MIIMSLLSENNNIFYMKSYINLLKLNLMSVELYSVNVMAMLYLTYNIQSG